MKLKSRSTQAVFYVLVFISGAAGLIYQVVWHKYLSLLLGAQAWATAMVLAIFLGGISLGYAVFGHWTRSKRWNLFFVYSLVEMGLAFWGMSFPDLFGIAFHQTPRWLAVVGLENRFLDITIAVALLGFPTFLMGGTLPLLTQGLSESLAESSKTHARIYGWNTVGACFGSLLAGFGLVPFFRLTTCVSIAACMNLVVALVAYFAFARGSEPQTISTRARKASRGKVTAAEWTLLTTGFLSGFYVICLESVLIRLVGLSTGSSNYNFSVIVSIFVLALGAGSLMVKRISTFSFRHLLWNQIGIGFFLLGLYFCADRWPYWVHLIRISFRDIDQNFYVYQAALGLFFGLLLALPIGFCGLTLPLCFHLLKDKIETLGFRVGQLYAINTIGCVLGAWVGGYYLLNFLNLDQLFKLCMFMALLSACIIGVYLARKEEMETKLVAGVITAALTLLIGIWISPDFTKERYYQPFRQQHPLNISYDGVDAWTTWLSSSSKYVFYKDGPNTSVGVGSTSTGGSEVSRTVFVNGKSDGNTKGDYFTMNLTGLLPGLFARTLQHACVIGMGTGISLGALARFPTIESIENVEIAESLIKARHYFDPFNGNVSTNPKIHVHAMDAFRYLGGTKEVFDVIVSEPSNPWVAGVENLYTQEFYDIAKRRLASDGLYVQWVQAYSFNDKLLRSVLRTISSRFKYVSVFQMLEQDLALIASDKPLSREDVLRAEKRIEEIPAVQSSLRGMGITQMETLLALEVVPSSLTAGLGQEGELITIENPRLSHEAAKAFFVGSSARIHALRRELKEFYPAVDQSLLSQYLNGKQIEYAKLDKLRITFCEPGASYSKNLCDEILVMSKWIRPEIPLDAIYESKIPRSEYRSLASFRINKNPRGFSEADLDFLKASFGFYKRFYSPIAQLPVGPILDGMEQCFKFVPFKSELYGDCILQKAAMLEIAKPEEREFLAVIRKYGDWFAELPPSSPAYERFKKAFDVLDKVITEVTHSRLAPNRS